MLHFKRSDIDAMEKIFRLNLINSCTGYKSANLIGTQSKEGKTNLAVFSSITHLGSNPPLIGFVLRPTTVPRDTYRNLKESSLFTVNHIHYKSVADAHHTSAKYPENLLYSPSITFTTNPLQMHITPQPNIQKTFRSLAKRTSSQSISMVFKPPLSKTPKYDWVAVFSMSTP